MYILSTYTRKNLHIKINADRAAINIKQEINEKIKDTDDLDVPSIVSVELNYNYGKTILTTSYNIDSDYEDDRGVNQRKRLHDLDKSDDLLIGNNRDEFAKFMSPPTKRNFYVTFTMDQENINDEMINDNLVLVKNINIEQFSVYYYANESLAFFSNENELNRGPQDGKINSFFLHRIKKI